MSAGNILYAIEDGACLIRMEGRITYALGPSFSAFIDGLFDAGPVGEVVVDLSRAVYLDSTSLGLLGKLANAVQRRLQRKVTVLAPSDDVNTILTSMGFDAVFTILREGGGGELELQGIPAQERSECERAKIILDAHRLLRDMNEANAARFRDVVDLLEKEISDKAKGAEKTGG